MRRYGLLLTLLLFSIVGAAQSVDQISAPDHNDVSIGAMTVNRAGSQITIEYQLILGEDVKWCKTKLLVSIDGGRTFSFHPDENYISGDLGLQTSSGTKYIIYDVSKDKTNLAGKRIVFKVDVVSKDVLKHDILVAGQAGVFPQMSYGLMFGMVRKFGWYIKAKSDFCFPSSSYNCTSNGEIEGGGYIWTEGSSKRSRLVITAGGMVKAARWCYPYVGAGYGSRGLYWMDYLGDWAKVSDSSCAGLAIDAGLVFKLGKVAVTIGVNNTAFKYTEAEVGIGVMF